MEKIIDLFGKELHVGDNVITSHTASTNVSYLEAGEIIDIIHKKVVTNVVIKITNSGDTYHPYWNTGIERIMRFPREYCNLIKID